MRSPINAAADWICKRSRQTEDTLVTTVGALMVSTFLTVVAIGGGMDILPVLFG